MKRLSFSELVSDISSQDVAWRQLARKCADYYDHLQLTDKRLQDLKACERLDVVGNLIQPTINSVLGHEEQRRVDWMIVADDMDSEEVAEGLNQRLNEVMRLTEANRHCSEAYKHQIIKGIGWLHVSRNPDPFDASAYKIERIPTDEIYWDMRSKDAGKRDCRWMARRKFMDVDEVKTLFPGHGDLTDACANGWTGTFSIGDDYANTDLRMAEWVSSSSHQEHLLLSSGRRKQVAVYEVYYREWVTAKILTFDDGRMVEYQEGSSEQLLALLTGAAKGEKRQVQKMRRKYFIGPHEISDDASPHPHNHFPFVCFEGYMEDTANVPYGLVRGMLDPQDAYNEAGFEIMHILDHIRVIKEEDSLVDGMRDSDLVDELRRRDGVVTARNGKSGTIRVEKDWAELQALNGLQDKYGQQIRDYSGVYSSYSGRDAGQKSGVAISNMAELGATTLSEINANYEYGRKKLAELVLAYIVHDIADKETPINIRDGDAGQVKKRVVLNGREQGDGQTSNVVSLARTQVALADVHSSQGYRQHVNSRVMEMFQVTAQNPEMQAFLLELAVETSELPNRAEILEKWRKKMGISEDVDDPEKQAQEQQAAQQAAETRMKMEMDAANAKIAEDNASAQLDIARAAKIMFDIEQAQDQAEFLKRKARIDAELALV